MNTESMSSRQFQPSHLLVFGWAAFCVVLNICAVRTAVAQDEPNLPNVLFILSDDQRPDTIAYLGNDTIETPNLDALAKRGVSFRRAVCANPICTPSRAEILSGCSGFRNGVLDFGKPIDPELTLWPEAMQAAGYRTYYVGKWHNDGKPIERGFDQSRGLFASGGGRWWESQKDWKGMDVSGYRGWIFQDDDGNLFPERGVGLSPEISRRFADAAIELIRDSSDQPFFIQLSFTAPHDPLFWPPEGSRRYDADEITLPKNFLAEHPFDHGNFNGRDERLLSWPRTEQEVRELTAVYYSILTDMDRQIGRVIAALDETGKLEDTIVIFTSDHGLGVGSHGLRGKQNMYEHTINVPLILAGPGIQQDARSDAQVYLRELYPTTLDLVHVDVPPTVEGKSFARVLTGQEETAHEHVFCYFRDLQRMVRDDRWKLIHYPKIDRLQLFDLENDPHELRDLSDDSNWADEFERLKGLLASERERHEPR